MAYAPVGAWIYNLSPNPTFHDYDESAYSLTWFSKKDWGAGPSCSGSGYQNWIDIYFGKYKFYDLDCECNNGQTEICWDTPYFVSSCGDAEYWGIQSSQSYTVFE